MKLDLFLLKSIDLFDSVWDGFVSAKIQQWEQFYIKWLEEGKNVLVIVYENLKTEKLRKSLKDISKFLNKKMDDHRLECTILHSEGKFHRKAKCITAKFHDNGNSDYLRSENQNLTDDIFSADNRLRINNAIDNVNKAMMSRGFDYLPLKEYKNTTIQLTICP